MEVEQRLGQEVLNVRFELNPSLEVENKVERIFLLTRS